eukprot:284815419_2
MSMTETPVPPDPPMDQAAATILGLVLMGDSARRIVEVSAAEYFADGSVAPSVSSIPSPSGSAECSSSQSRDAVFRFIAGQLALRLPLIRLVNPASGLGAAEVSAEAVRNVLQAQNFHGCFTCVTGESAGSQNIVAACLFSILSQPPGPADVRVPPCQDPRVEYCSRTLADYPPLFWDAISQSSQEIAVFEVGPIAVSPAFSNRKLGHEIIKRCVAEAARRNCDVITCNSGNHFLSLILREVGFTRGGVVTFPSYHLPDGTTVQVERIY